MLCSAVPCCAVLTRRGTPAQAMQLLSIVIVVSASTPIVLVVVVALAVPYYALAKMFRWSSRDLRRLDSTSK